MLSPVVFLALCATATWADSGSAVSTPECADDSCAASDTGMSLFQANIKLQSKMDTKELQAEEEEFLHRAADSTHKAELYSKEARILMELRDVDKEIEDARAKQQEDSKNGTHGSGDAKPDAEQAEAASPDADQSSGVDSKAAAQQPAAMAAKEAMLDEKLVTVAAEHAAEATKAKVVEEAPLPYAFGGEVAKMIKRFVTVG